MAGFAEVSSCTGLWCLENPPQWRQEFGSSRVTADAREEDNGTGPLRENVSRKNGACRHVPHRDKQPQVVARRNARERKRVQAVNNAFNRLRKVVPVENTRGKRISKVKTLQYAIEYIHKLQELLEKGSCYDSFETTSYYGYTSSTEDFLSEMDFCE